MFSDGYLAEDGFLLKHVQKNKQGYVSLKLLTCLKKVNRLFLTFCAAIWIKTVQIKKKKREQSWVCPCLLQIKALTTDWYLTLAVADCSDLLEVNDECTKVRRKEPLPQWLMGSPTSRLLLVWNDSDDQRKETGATGASKHPSLLLKVLEKFTSPSSISSIWILRPGETLPKELQCYAKRHKELGQHVCAVVKFNQLEAVRRTFTALKEEEKMNEKGLQVVPLGWHSMQSVAKSEPSEGKHRNQPEADICSEENLPETPKVLVQREPSPVNVCEESSKAFPREGCQNESATSFNGLSFCGKQQKNHRTSWNTGDHDKWSSQSPWVLRRKSAASAVNPNAWHSNAPCLIQTLHQPLGPDGTRGFHTRRKWSDPNMDGIDVADWARINK